MSAQIDLVTELTGERGGHMCSRTGHALVDTGETVGRFVRRPRQLFGTYLGVFHVLRCIRCSRYLQREFTHDEYDDLTGQY